MYLVCTHNVHHLEAANHKWTETARADFLEPPWMKSGLTHVRLGRMVREQISCHRKTSEMHDAQLCFLYLNSSASEFQRGKLRCRDSEQTAQEACEFVGALNISRGLNALFSGRPLAQDIPLTLGMRWSGEFHSTDSECAPRCPGRVLFQK